jgi:hypothetical protein
MVKVMKWALKSMTGRADLNKEEFHTVVSQIAHLLNCRPNQVVPNVDDLEPLTPNHSLFPDQAGAVFSTDVGAVTKVKLSERLRHQVMVQEHIWSRFYHEVVPLLGPRKRWSAELENWKVDGIVLELDENLPRCPLDSATDLKNQPKL